MLENKEFSILSFSLSKKLKEKGGFLNENKRFTKNKRNYAYSTCNYKNDLMILFVGTNNKLNSNTISTVISYIDSMIEYSNNSRYIVLGLTSKDYMSDIVAVNQALAQNYETKPLDKYKS